MAASPVEIILSVLRKIPNVLHKFIEDKGEVTMSRREDKIKIIIIIGIIISISIIE
jgi:hypothetical protein